eukprot:TRINITY_DN398_c0_g2_i24.p1 TRINITY_DN398_c0_g2~~TRINITY_DN398_c0_g2_i24.p1  ORF type:complete len:281 (-),score=82.52 TRINITY_DN398_c0_g2_i24:66-908(-)
MSSTLAGYNQAVACKRKERDVMKLLLSDYKVVPGKDSQHEFSVTFKGPVGSPYEGGVWDVSVLLPTEYPYKSPSIGFGNFKIYHPNIDEASGTVCLDVINQTWSPMFDLLNVFDIFLPQLLMYPNPKSPLNPEAASLMLQDQTKFEQKIKDYVAKQLKKGGSPTATAMEEEAANTQDESGGSPDSMDEEGFDDLSDKDQLSQLSETSEIDLLDRELQKQKSTSAFKIQQERSGDVRRKITLLQRYKCDELGNSSLHHFARSRNCVVPCVVLLLLLSLIHI